MPSVARFADLLHDLRQLERAAAPAHGRLILDAFGRHTPFAAGAVYMREAGTSQLRLAAAARCNAPELIECDPPREVTVSHRLPLDPLPHVVLPLHAHREPVGLVALNKDHGGIEEEELAMLRAAEAFLGTVISNHRLQLEAREGDFQLKYRLWELESLYDIGLSIAATLNIEELADEILFRMISLTNARRAALFLREGNRFRLYRSFGEVREDFLDQELAEQLVREGTPLSFEENTDCIFPGCCAYVALPIRGNNNVIGVLAAADRETREGGIGAFEA
ncbi:MAG TPA: GAF domain-containing protein, partial [Thermoanaerobaculia bacterium]|nr:GAF domain-containing protein [Thermoanaerobaculia bacterium]